MYLSTDVCVMATLRAIHFFSVVRVTIKLGFKEKKNCLKQQNCGISSSLEVTSSQTTLNIISDDKCLLDIGEIGVKLRLIEKLIRSCKDLIKQSTFIDVCMEAFTKNSDHFADALIQAESDLKQSCTGILSTIELNRNRTTITQRKEDKMINRDPGYYERNHKFTEEQLRYFVSVGPFQHRLHKFPKNKVLEAAKTTLEELYNFFTSSVKRYYCLRNILEQSTFGLTIKSLSDTRWTANYESLHCVVESFSEIIDCLESIELVESKQFDKETKTQAKNIKNKLMSYEFVVLLKFMVNVTRTTNLLTIHLQKKRNGSIIINGINDKYKQIDSKYEKQ
ncbi:unnamed protein product [Rotaria sordida]|uniref:Uncharacterized protein n=1 Tax=Rotaria sordida TaxID=392033 RepID=A0A815A184_9BILA|nr:unnamed protein product [Rotaria sordida]